VSNTDALYQEIILEHNRKPRNFREMSDADRVVQGRNPMCGDALTLWVKMGDDDRIADVSFKGEGCAISKSSASIMTTAVKGKTRAEAVKVFEKFHDLVTGNLPESDQASLGSMRAFGGVSRFPLRVKCASLAWHALKSALEGQVDVVTTDTSDPTGAPGEGA
jgi:nitrogen fixation protein NifU and related proteins